MPWHQLVLRDVDEELILDEQLKVVWLVTLERLSLMERSKIVKLKSVSYSADILLTFLKI